jgi:acetyltransferase-like isoleucine patch superfamily enzyme
VAPDVQFGSRVKISLDGGTHNRLEMGPGSAIHDDVLVLLRGGTIRFGPRVSVRRGSVLNVSGTLELEADNILSYYTVIHCAERVVMHQWASTNEYCTIVDSRHFHTDDDTFFYENVESAPIEVGRNVWLANKSSVLMGVTIGERAIVAGHSVVNKDVPAKSVVGGIPAKILRSS